MSSAPSPPVAALLRLITLPVLLLSPLALLAALLVLLVPPLRRVAPYVAYHSVQAACWQLVSNCITAGIYVGALLAGLTPQGWTQSVMDDLNNLFTAPVLFLQRWPVMMSIERLAVLLLLALLAVNVTIALVGAVVVLRGRVYRLPVIGALCAPLLRPHGASRAVPAAG